MRLVLFVKLTAATVVPLFLLLLCMYTLCVLKNIVYDHSLLQYRI